MAIRDTIGDALDSMASRFSARLGNWLGKFIAHGIEGFADIVGKSYSKKLQTLIATVESTGEVPPELKPLLDEIKNPTGEAGMFIGASMGNSLVGGTIERIVNPILLPIGRALNRINPQVKVGGSEILNLMFRFPAEYDTWRERLMGMGFDDSEIKLLTELKSVRFPSDVVGPAWLRDKAKYEKLWNDVKINMGMIDMDADDQLRMDLIKEMLYAIPNVSAVIRYAVKEAYSPEIYKAFGQDQEFPVEAMPDAERAGVREDYLRKEWIAHWTLPSAGQGFDLLHRGEITEDEVKKLLKALDIMPFWRDKLVALSWDLPTRVELRLMARYGLIDKKALIEILGKSGVDPAYREMIADMNIAMGIVLDVQTQYRNKWINSEGVRAALEASGMAAKTVDMTYRWIVANTAPERTAAEKDLTKAEIVKGVKQGIMDWQAGVDQLVRLGYDASEANYLLAINIEVVTEPAGTELTVRVDTIRRMRRQRQISRDQEIASLLDVGIEVSLATAYADNDDLRLIKETTTTT